MTAFSILMPIAPPGPEQVLPYAALTQRSEAHRLWQGQAALNQPHQSFVYAAAAGYRVPAGLAVSVLPLMHPYEAAVQAHSMALATGHPVVAGFGPGAAVLQRNMLGAPYRSPLTAVREYFGAVRGLLDGDQVRLDGEYFTCHAMLPRVERPSVELGLGVLQPKMARLAGEIADAAITWLAPARYLRDVLVPALHEGAQGAGRPVPRLVALVPVALDEPGRDSAALALAASAGHIRLPHYASMLDRSGIHVDPADPTASAGALMSGRAFLYGNAAAIREGLDEFREAGVDEIVLSVTGVHATYGNQAALHELDTLLEAVP
ncbi:LLM class flavin-dependent oxidoreductase [Streptomyces sp. NPDC002659]|uniref:LLM class flavin-dependent oxidoreductase n=1 Tax=Streptomyces sp. NPDC002659 TaxID=3364656 RepID=UPI0036ACAFBC